MFYQSIWLDQCVILLAVHK